MREITFRYHLSFLVTILSIIWNDIGRNGSWVWRFFALVWGFCYSCRVCEFHKRSSVYIIRTKICKSDNHIFIINDNASIHKTKNDLDAVEENKINFFSQFRTGLRLICQPKIISLEWNLLVYLIILLWESKYVTIPAIYNYIKNELITLKNASVHPQPRNAPEIKRQCKAMAEYLLYNQPKAYVFIDGFGFNLSTQRRMGWSKCGTQAINITPLQRGVNVSVWLAVEKTKGDMLSRITK